MAPRGGRRDRPSKDLDPTKFDLLLRFLHGRLEGSSFSRFCIPRRRPNPENQHSQLIHRGCRAYPLPLFATPGHGRMEVVPKGDYQDPCQ